MGNLKPNTTYIYERSEGIVYAREFGSDPGTRVVVGYESGSDYDSRTSDGRPLREHLKEDALWGDIRRLAKTNSSLQDELDRVIMLYYLIKEQQPLPKHHSV